MIYIGVDPGKSGAIAAIDDTKVDWIKCSESEHDLALWLAAYDSERAFAFIERVGAMPKQGISSTFKFGVSYGTLRGLLAANLIGFEEVGPVKWQTAMGCRTKGDKNVSKARAQQLFPHLKITHANADAILIAEHCRRVVSERNRAA